MKKTDLKNAVQTTKNETKTALQTVYDSLNQGQQKKILKNEKVKNLFEFYQVNL